MTDTYEGDTLLSLTEEGAEIVFSGDAGQPVMDQGIENFAMLSLFAPKKWAGNLYADEESERIESDYEETNKLPTTISNLELVRQSTIKSLKDPIFGDVTSDIDWSKSNRRINDILIKPPSQDPLKIQLIQNGSNWINQAGKQ